MLTRNDKVTESSNFIIGRFVSPSRSFEVIKSKMWDIMKFSQNMRQESHHKRSKHR